MVIQSKDYIKKQKKKYGIKTFIWICIVASMYVTGYIVFDTRNNFLTVGAAVCVLGIAQNLVRFLSFGRFKDPEEAFSEAIDAMAGMVHVFHGAIIPDTKDTIGMDHIIVTDNRIYLLNKNEKVFQKYRILLENKFLAKGIDIHQLQFIKVDTLEKLRGVIAKIQKEMGIQEQSLTEKSKIINEMLM